MKKHLYFAIVIVLIIFAVSCSGAQDNDGKEETSTEKIFTLEELAEYDGKEGKPAYIAVDGIVYDMSEIGSWEDGEHNGFSAGADVTDALANEAPHGTAQLGQAKIVGRLAQ